MQTKGTIPSVTRGDPIQCAHGESLPDCILNYEHHVDMLLASLCTYQQYMLMWIYLQKVIAASQALSYQVWLCAQALVAQREASMLTTERHADDW